FFVSLFSSSARASTELYTLSLHDALPIFGAERDLAQGDFRTLMRLRMRTQCDAMLLAHGLHGAQVLFKSIQVQQQRRRVDAVQRSEEHTSELQSRENLVCRLLLEKKKRNE